MNIMEVQKLGDCEVYIHDTGDEELVIDCGRAGEAGVKNHTGPRIWIQRIPEDVGRPGWRIYIHPHDGDPSHGIDIPDDTQVPQVEENP